MAITIKNARLSYPRLFKAEKSEFSDKEMYSCVLLIPKNDTETIQQVRDAIFKAIPVEYMQNGKPKAGFRLPIKDGDAANPDGTLVKKGEEYRGMLYLQVKSERKPSVVVKESGIYKEAGEDKVYAGCWVHANVNFAPYSKAGNTGVSGWLNAVCKSRDDEPFSGGQTAEEMFGDVADTATSHTPAAASADDWMS